MGNCTFFFVHLLIISSSLTMFFQGRGPWDYYGKWLPIQSLKEVISNVVIYVSQSFSVIWLGMVASFEKTDWDFEKKYVLFAFF